MITETPTTTNDTRTIGLNREIMFHRSLCWGAIIAGAVTAIGMHLLLLFLGTAIGLATFSPMSDANPTEAFVMGSAIAWGVCAVAALFVGGWVTGCFSASPKSGSLHGIVVWSLTLMITIFMAAAGSGTVLGGAVKSIASVVGGAGKSLAMGGMAAGGAMAGNSASSSSMSSASNQMSGFISEAVKSSPTNSTPASKVRTERDLNLAVMKLFTPGGDVNSQDNQAAVVKVLTQDAGMSDADAKKMVNDWVASYNNLKEQLEQAKNTAEQKAREAAQAAKDKVAAAAGVTFLALVVGLVLTVCGSILGGKKTYYHTTTGVINS